MGNFSSSKIRAYSGSHPQHSEQERKRERKHVNQIRPPFEFITIIFYDDNLQPNFIVFWKEIKTSVSFASGGSQAFDTWWSNLYPLLIQIICPSCSEKVITPTFQSQIQHFITSKLIFYTQELDGLENYKSLMNFNFPSTKGNLEAQGLNPLLFSFSEKALKCWLIQHPGRQFKLFFVYFSLGFEQAQTSTFYLMVHLFHTDTAHLMHSCFKYNCYSARLECLHEQILPSKIIEYTWFWKETDFFGIWIIVIKWQWEGLGRRKERIYSFRALLPHLPAIPTFHGNGSDEILGEETLKVWWRNMISEQF